VDPWFIVSETPEQARLIRAAREVNSGKPDWVVEKIKTAVGEFLQANPDKRAGDVTIACFGLAFKPDIDDLRESPALDIATRVAAEHPGPLLAVEPNIKALPADEALADADVVVALVAHRSFRRVAPAALDGKRVVDACGLWNRVVP